MLTPQEALRLILDRIEPLGSERLPLTAALGRVTAETVTSPLTLPPFDNSAMDGFALASDEVKAASECTPVRLPIQARLAAGEASQPLWAAHAIRIMTGAPLPEGADTVLRLEDADEQDGHLVFRRPLAQATNVRRAGEDLRAGDVVLEGGQPLTPARLALLAATGSSHVAVYRRPTVALLTTGDELVEPGQPLRAGQIYNSNQYALWAMALAMGGEPRLIGVARDDEAVTRDLLEQALACDLVISSGGVSQGDFDWVGRLLRQMGTVHFSQVAQQPGKPLTFATVAGKPVFGLPGNPAATMVSMEVYVRPALRKMMGYPQWLRPSVKVRLVDPLPAPNGRQLFLRAWVEAGRDGLEATLSGAQGSGLLTSMAKANALVIVPANPNGGHLEALMLDQEVRPC